MARRLFLCYMCLCRRCLRDIACCTIFLSFFAVLVRPKRWGRGVWSQAWVCNGSRGLSDGDRFLRVFVGSLSINEYVRWWHVRMCYRSVLSTSSFILLLRERVWMDGWLQAASVESATD